MHLKRWFVVLQEIIEVEAFIFLFPTGSLAVTKQWSQEGGCNPWTLFLWKRKRTLQFKEFVQ